jgi:hypothetical protein
MYNILKSKTIIGGVDFTPLGVYLFCIIFILILAIVTILFKKYAPGDKHVKKLPKKKIGTSNSNNINLF